MTTELLRSGYSNISCTEDQCAVSGVVISTELKRLQLFFFNLFVRETENYISIQRQHSIPFKQLLAVTSERKTC